MSTKSTMRKGKILLQNHDYHYDSWTREEEEEDCEDEVEEAVQEAADEEEEEANIEEYGLNLKPSITNSLFPGQRACDQQDLDFLSKIWENSWLPFIIIWHW